MWKNKKIQVPANRLCHILGITERSTEPQRWQSVLRADVNLLFFKSDTMVASNKSKAGTKSKTTSVPQQQSEKFKAMTKELEADSDEKSFDKTLKNLAKPNARVGK